MMTPEDRHERQLAAQRKYRAAHLEERRAQDRRQAAKRRAEHGDEVRAAKRKDYEKHKERNNRVSREYYRDNQERMQEYRRKYVAQHHEQVKEGLRLASRKNYAAHRDQVLARCAAYHAAHPEKAVEKSRRRRARKLNAAGFDYTTAQHLEWRRQMWGGRCYLCGAEDAVAMDHVIPLAKGGSHWPANQRPICTHCNSSKGVKLLVEYLGLKKVEAVA